MNEPCQQFTSASVSNRTQSTPKAIDAVAKTTPFKRYWVQLRKHAGAREVFARSVGSTVGYLALVAGGHATPSAKLALLIEKASAGRVPVESLLPDHDWAVLLNRRGRS